MAIAVVEVDDLKALNDEHGHLAGDLVLRHVGKLLREVSREADVVARIAGDEFGVLAVDCGPGGADALAGRLQAQLEAAGLAASVGAAAKTSTTSLEEVFAGADRAMYEHKERRKKRPDSFAGRQRRGTRVPSSWASWPVARSQHQPHWWCPRWSEYSSERHRHVGHRRRPWVRRQSQTPVAVPARNASATITIRRTARTSRLSVRPPPAPHRRPSCPPPAGLHRRSVRQLCHPRREPARWRGRQHPACSPVLPPKGRSRTVAGMGAIDTSWAVAPP